ncbi:MAG: hypothetical protein ACSW8F_00405, partial [bacterium]
MKRKGILALFLALACLLSACGGVGSAPEEPTPAKEETTAPAETSPVETAPVETSPVETTPVEPNEPAQPVANEKQVELRFSELSAPAEGAPLAFNAKFEGADVSAEAAVVDGAYRVTAAKTDGESWHIKLESQLPTRAGNDYRLTFTFLSNVAGQVKLGDNQVFDITAGENTVTGTLHAAGEVTYVDLQLGSLAPFTIDFTGIVVEELDGGAAASGALQEAAAEAHDPGYETALTTTRDTATLAITRAPADADARGVWKAKLLIRTGARLEKGKTYRVSFRLAAKKAQSDYEICFDGGETENAYGALYGRSIAAGATDTVEYYVTPEKSAGLLTLRLQLGKTDSAAGNTFTLSGLKVQEVSTQSQPLAVAALSTAEAVTEARGEGYDQTLSRAEDGVTLTMNAVPEEGAVYGSKLFVKTGAVLQPGEQYEIGLTLASAQAMGLELCYNRGAEEKGFGALYGQELGAGEEKSFTYTVSVPAEAAAEELVLQLMLGLSPAGNTVSLRDVAVRRITESAGENALPAPIRYAAAGSVSFWAHEDYAAELTGGENAATLAMKSLPAEGREVWKLKLFADTGLVPTPGKSYRVSFALAAEEAQELELCYNSGETEKGYDVLYGQSIAAGEKKTFEKIVSVPASLTDPRPLVLQISLGLASEPCSVTLSDVRVEELRATYTDVLPADFNFQSAIAVLREGEKKTPIGYTSVLPASFAYNIGTPVTEWHHEGYAAALEKSASSAVMTLTAAPETGREVWMAKLFVDTGAALKAGKTYRISARLSATNAFDYEICYNDGGAEKGVGARYGLTASAEGETVTETLTAGKDAALVLQFSLGCAPAGTAVTVEQVEVVEINASAEDITPAAFAYPVTTAATTETVAAHYEAQTLTLSAQAIAWDGSAATASTGESTASLQVTAARSGGGGWSTRLHVGTGVTLEEGAQYKVSSKLTANAALNFELLYSNGFDENDGFNPGGKGYDDGSYGLSAAAGVTTDAIEKVFTVPTRSAYHELVLRYQLGDTPAPNEITASNISVEKWIPAYEKTVGGTTEANSFALEANEGAAASLTGDGTKASVLVTTPGDDWHLKLYAKPGLTLAAGETCRVSFRVTGAAGCSAVYKRVGGAEDAFGTENITADGVITHLITPDTAGELELILKLGTVPADGVVTVSEFKVEKLTQSEGASLLPAAFRMDTEGHLELFAFEGYAAALTGGESADVQISSVPAGQEPWKVKLFLDTKAPLQAGKSYRVRFTVSADAPQPFEVTFNNGGAEAALGARYGLTASAEGTPVEYTLTPAADATLVLQLNLGAAAPGSFDLGGLSVEEITYSITPTSWYSNLPGPVSFWAHEDYSATLSGGAEAATLSLASVPEEGREPWKVKLFLDSGAVLTPGELYRVRLAVSAAGELPFEICYNAGGVEKGFDAAYGLRAEAGQTVTVEKLLTASSSAPLVLQLNLGDAPAANEITVSDLSVERVTLLPGENALPAPLRYTTEADLELWHHEDYRASLRGTGESALVSVAAAPKEGAEPWKVKLFAKTGAVLTPGEGYRVSADLTAQSAAAVELCCNNGAQEAGYGSQTGISLAAGETLTLEKLLSVPADMETADLVLQLNLGAAGENEVTLSNIRVEKVALQPGESALPAPIAWSARSTVNAWAHEDYRTALSADGASAAMELLSVPEAGREPWKVKLFVETGAKLAAGKRYRVSLDVTAAAPLKYEMTYNDGAAEAALGARRDLAASQKKSTVSFTVEPAKAAELILQLNLGAAAGQNTVTVSNVRVEELTQTAGRSLLPKGFTLAQESAPVEEKVLSTRALSFAAPQPALSMFNGNGAAGAVTSEEGKFTYEMTSISTTDG